MNVKPKKGKIKRFCLRRVYVGNTINKSFVVCFFRTLKSLQYANISCDSPSQ